MQAGDRSVREGLVGRQDLPVSSFRLRWTCAPALLPDRRESGMSLVEVLVALVLLSVGLLGLAMFFPVELRLGAHSQVSNGALLAAQRELDQIRQNIFSPSGSFMDMDGNTLDASCGGTPGTSCGNPLAPDGTIDFSAAPAVGYSVQLKDSSGQSYSVRWNLAVTANDGRKIVLGSRALNLPPGSLARAMQIQTMVAR